MVFVLRSPARHSFKAMMPCTIRLPDPAAFGIRRGRDENRNAFAPSRQFGKLDFVVGAMNSARATCAETHAHRAGNLFQVFPALGATIFKFAVADVDHVKRPYHSVGLSLNRNARATRPAARLLVVRH